MLASKGDDDARTGSDRHRAAGRRRSRADAPCATLAELGLRVGSHVRCVQRTSGGGRIVDVSGSRIALGRDVLESVEAVAAHPVEATRA